MQDATTWQSRLRRTQFPVSAMRQAVPAGSAHRGGKRSIHSACHRNTQVRHILFVALSWGRSYHFTFFISNGDRTGRVFPWPITVLQEQRGSKKGYRTRVVRGSSADRALISIGPRWSLSGLPPSMCWLPRSTTSHRRRIQQSFLRIPNQMLFRQEMLWGGHKILVLYSAIRRTLTLQMLTAHG